MTVWNSSRGKKPNAKRVHRIRALGGKCAYCGSDRDLTLDHIVPRSRGGSNCVENLQVLCMKCNTTRGNKPCKIYGTPPLDALMISNAKNRVLICADWRNR